MIRPHDLAFRCRLIGCVTVFATLCVLTASGETMREEKMTTALAESSKYWWPSNSADAALAENIPAASNSPAELPPVTEAKPDASPDQTIDTVVAPAPVEKKSPASYNVRLAAVRNLVNSRQYNLAEPALVALLAENVPDDIRRTAMLNLGALVQEENDLPRAQTIFAQFLDRWPADVRTPEVLLRQGDIFRQMGLTGPALAKYYSVMTAALSLKNDQFAHYQRLVYEAQVRIAESHFESGRFAEAADFYSRLLKHIDNSTDRPQIQFRLVRSLNAIGKNEEATGQARDFLAQYPDASEEPEVRYYLAQSLKAAGQTGEALRQVMIFLRDQKRKSTDRPEVWAYWQQRVGNEIANQLYKEGDYVKALEVYMGLTQLDTSPAWQMPVNYQVGLTYERLLQPQKAIETYQQILTQETVLGTNATPGLKAVLEMSRWRKGFLEWQNQAVSDIHVLASSTKASSLTTSNPPPESTNQ
jgi:TolA-binding protein